MKQSIPGRFFFCMLHADHQPLRNIFANSDIALNPIDHID
jgi:hypothetical protein